MWRYFKWFGTSETVITTVINKVVLLLIILLWSGRGDQKSDLLAHHECLGVIFCVVSLCLLSCRRSSVLICSVIQGKLMNNSKLNASFQYCKPPLSKCICHSIINMSLRRDLELRPLDVDLQILLRSSLCQNASTAVSLMLNRRVPMWQCSDAWTDRNIMTLLGHKCGSCPKCLSHARQKNDRNHSCEVRNI